MNPSKPDTAKNSAPLSEKIALFLLGVTALVNLYSTQPILNDLSVWARVDVTEAAWTVSAATVGVALTAPIAGVVSDRLGRRRIMVIAIAVMAVLTILASFSWDFYSLLFIRLVQGICCPFIFTTAVAYISEEYAHPLSLKLNALYVAGTAFGGFLGRMLSAAIVDVTGSWRLSFVGNSTILVLILFYVWWRLPSERNLRPYSREDSRGASSSRIGFNPRVIFTILVGATLLFQQVGMFTFASLALTAEPFSLSTSAVGLIFVIFLLPTITTPWFGRVNSVIGPRYSFVLSQVVSMIGVALTLIPSVVSVCVGLAMSCIGVFAGQSVGTAMAGRLIPDRKSAIVGLYLSGYYLGGAIAAVALGPVYVVAGWSGVASIIMVIITASALISWASWNLRSS